MFSFLMIQVLFFVYFKKIREVCAEDARQFESDFDALVPELYNLYKDAFQDDSKYLTRRFYKGDKQYILHVEKLKEVNGLKAHNLKVEGKNRKMKEGPKDPIIYINNPVEARMPNTFLSQEEFKKAMYNQALKQKKDFIFAKFLLAPKKKPNRTNRTMANNTPFNVVMFVDRTTTASPEIPQIELFDALVLNFTNEIYQKIYSNITITSTTTKRPETESTADKISSTLSSIIDSTIQEVLNTEIVDNDTRIAETTISDKSETNDLTTTEADDIEIITKKADNIDSTTAELPTTQAPDTEATTDEVTTTQADDPETTTDEVMTTQADDPETTTVEDSETTVMTEEETEAETTTEAPTTFSTTRTKRTRQARPYVFVPDSPNPKEN